MLNYTIHPCTRPLRGTLRVPCDKSIAHRALLLAAMAQGESVITPSLIGQDNQATMAALRAMGVPIEIQQQEKEGQHPNQHPNQTQRSIHVQGVGLRGFKQPSPPLDLGNSGTGLRLLAGLLVGQSFSSQLMGDASLMQRPMQRIVEPLKQMGAHIQMSPEGTAPLHIQPTATLQGIRYAMPIASAQVKSCLLLAGLYAEGETCIQEPHPTRDHTERLLQSMGYVVDRRTDSICLRGGGTLKARPIPIPADLSSAAFFMVAATQIPQSDILLLDVGINPSRIGVITLLRAMGAHITLENKRNWGNEPVADIRVQAAPLKGIEIPAEQVPLSIDEFPILLIAAACAQGKTTLRGAEELRVKESDRIAAMAAGLSRLGVAVTPYPDGITVEGSPRLNGNQTIESYADHRIAMSFAVAGAVASAPLVVQHCDLVETSFPGFQTMARALGLNIETRSS